MGKFGKIILSKDLQVNGQHNILMQDQCISKSELKDYSITKTSPDISSGTLTLDLETGNVFSVSFNTHIITLTITNPSPTGTYCSFRLSLVCDGSARTVIWPSSIIMEADPVMTGFNAKYDFLLATIDSGTTWHLYQIGSVMEFVVSPRNPYGIIGFGSISGVVSHTNLISRIGIIAADTTGVGIARMRLAAAGYGDDKAIFGYGQRTSYLSTTNLVSNAGVVATDTTGVGSIRAFLAAAEYGDDKAIFGYGTTYVTNLVSNTGVVATDTTGVGTARYGLAAAGYGDDKVIFGFGGGPDTAITNLVSNTGVVATDTTGVGTARSHIAATEYGEDMAIFGFGSVAGIEKSMTNLVSNTGVVATDTTGVGAARIYLAAAGYGGDKGIFLSGYDGSKIIKMSNLVSNTGLVSLDVSIIVASAAMGHAGAGFG